MLDWKKKAFKSRSLTVFIVEIMSYDTESIKTRCWQLKEKSKKDQTKTSDQNMLISTEKAETLSQQFHNKNHIPCNGESITSDISKQIKLVQCGTVQTERDREDLLGRCMY